MQNARENLHGLWRSQRGLMTLLAVGLAVSLLAVLAPQAWATPDQSPLRQTTTDIEPTQPECFRACDQPITIRTTGDGFNVTAQTAADVYVTENALWTPAGVTGGGDPYSGTLVADLNVVHQTQVTIGSNGHFIPNPVTVWSPPLLAGNFDVFFDVNRNGEFDNDDAVLYPDGPSPDDPEFGAGICIDLCPIGGTTLPRRAGLGLWWIALAALVGGGGVTAFVWGRRRR